MISILSPDTLIVHDVSCGGDAISLPREFGGRRVSEVWAVLNECAVRITGPIDTHNALRASPGVEWQQNGDRLSYHPKPMRSGAREDVLIAFVPLGKQA